MSDKLYDQRPRGENEPGQIIVERRDGNPLVGNLCAWPSPDANDNFSVDYVPPGNYSLHCWAGKLDDSYTAVAQVTEKSSTAHVEMRPSHHIGQITGNVSGRIFSSAKSESDEVSVLAFPKDALGYKFSFYPMSGKIDETSRTYRIKKLSAGTYGLLVSSSFKARAPFVWIPDVEVREGLEHQFDIQIPESRLIRITLDYVDPPLRATWSLRMKDGTSIPYDWLIGGGDPGRFAGPRLFRLHIGEYQIDVNFGEHGRYTRTLKVEPGEGTQEFTFEMPK